MSAAEPVAHPVRVVPPDLGVHASRPGEFPLFRKPVGAENPPPLRVRTVEGDLPLDLGPRRVELQDLIEEEAPIVAEELGDVQGLAGRGAGASGT